MPGPEIDLSVYENEEALLAGLRRGEPDACTCFMKHFAPLIYAHALRMTSDADEAEEVLQTTFIKACDKFTTFEQRSSLSTWLYRIATNEALMLLRRRRASLPSADAAAVPPDDVPQQAHSCPGDIASIALNAELRTQLETALANLPESLRVVFVLREMEGLSTEETAVKLELGESAVKVRLHRARLRLREQLAAYMGSDDPG